MARNAGLKKKATGEWIYFLDSDDELVSGADTEMRHIGTYGQMYR